MLNPKVKIRKKKLRQHRLHPPKEKFVMRIEGLNHFNIATHDLELSAKFYESLGLVRGHRPAFSTTGIWMYCDGLPILHLNDEREVGPILKGGVAAVHHVGLTVRGKVQEVCGHLNLMDVKYDLWDPIPGCCRALYFTGPSGEAIEFVMVDEPVPEN